MQTAILLIGPTASGKTQTAFQLALHVNGYIINADSMQLYGDLSILTARPTRAERHAYQTIPYALDGVLCGQEKASVAWWLQHAAEHMQKAWSMNRIPVLVGGTGMYMQAMLHGISDVPAVSLSTRTKIRTLYAQENLKNVQDILLEKDPQTPLYKDKQRLLRALEVLEETGQPLWSFQSKKKKVIDADFTTLALLPPRANVYKRINMRFDGMMEAGALEEVRRLMALNLPEDHPLLGAVGVKELTTFLKGECAYEAAIQKAKQHSRNYAKRQYTWISKQMSPDFVWEDAPQNFNDIHIKI